MAVCVCVLYINNPRVARKYNPATRTQSRLVYYRAVKPRRLAGKIGICARTRIYIRAYTLPTHVYKYIHTCLCARLRAPRVRTNNPGCVYNAGGKKESRMPRSHAKASREKEERVRVMGRGVGTRERPKSEEEIG